MRGSINNDYVYDAAGNIISDNQRTFLTNTYNKPTSISKSGYMINFSYGVGGKRFKRIETNYSLSSQPKHTHYVGNVEFVKLPNSSTWQAKRYIGDKILITHVGSAKTVRYMLTDHLGSTHVIAKANGQKEQEMSFDVFGARRNATNWAREHNKIPTFTSSITLRGYTGHEQLDELSLVHMGGRIYDPILGRFLQADPAIQQPNNIQSFNRYSYVMNNPLNKTDPSGYIWVTLASAILQSIAANTANSVLFSAITGFLKAYKFYGYFKLAKGTIKAIQGGGTAMANFAGGFAKSYVRGMLEGAVIELSMNYISSSEKQGNSSTNLKNKQETPKPDGQTNSADKPSPESSNEVRTYTVYDNGPNGGQKVIVDISQIHNLGEKFYYLSVLDMFDNDQEIDSGSLVLAKLKLLNKSFAHVFTNQSMLMGHMIREYRSNQKAVAKNMLKAVKYGSLATGVGFGVYNAIDNTELAHSLYTDLKNQSLRSGTVVQATTSAYSDFFEKVTQKNKVVTSVNIIVSETIQALPWDEKNKKD